MIVDTNDVLNVVLQNTKRIMINNVDKLFMISSRLKDNP